jgi:DNA-binding protein
MSVMTLFQNHDEVILKARGRAISHAVDVAEVVRKRFMAGKCDIKEINISAIEIVLEKISEEG